MSSKKQVNARVDTDLHAAIVARANGMEETSGGYLLLIAQFWYARGMPPVSDRESAVTESQRLGKRIAHEK